MYVTQKYDCYHRQANAKHFEKPGFRRFTSFYWQKGYKTEFPGYNLSKFGQKVQNKIMKNYTETQETKFCRNIFLTKNLETRPKSRTLCQMGLK